MTVKDEYDKLRKQYNLPSFNDLDKEFDLSCVEQENRVLPETRDRLKDRLDLGLAIIDKVVHPDTGSVISMIEHSFFDDDEKNSAWALAKRIMVLKRSITEASLLNDEKIDVTIIKQIYEQWPSIKQVLLGFVTKMKSSWEEQQASKENLRYLV
jgi:hypothetical protein